MIRATSEGRSEERASAIMRPPGRGEGRSGREGERRKGSDAKGDKGRARERKGEEGGGVCGKDVEAGSGANEERVEQRGNSRDGVSVKSTGSIKRSGMVGERKSSASQSPSGSCGS